MTQSEKSIALLVSPMTEQEAALLTSRILGRYTTVTLSNPKVWSAEMITTLMKYAQQVGERAVDEACRSSPKYVPGPAMIDKLCWDDVHAVKEAVGFAQQYNTRSRIQIAERYGSGQRYEAPERLRGDGCYANVFVRSDRPQYERMKTLAEQCNDHREWRIEDGGIYIPMRWLGL